MTSALPAKELLQSQAEWLAPARARLLRRVGIARRRRILDLGAGYGAVTGELVRRGGGFVAALDTSTSSVTAISSPAFPLCGDALSLPFADESFDLVFCQCVLMWVTSTGSVTATSTGSVTVTSTGSVTATSTGSVTATSTGLATAVSEIYRVLEPNGVLIALEPDYAGMIEHPPEIGTREIWLSALTRAGAETHVGRKLPGLLTAQGFDVRVDLLDSVKMPSSTRLDFLRTLSLLPEEMSTLDRVMTVTDNLTGTWEQVAHLPFFLISATKF
ncbi:MAG: class I SAM-dependent methyltransferase [Anaerolineae bacterium]|nr:class I SAM-dependent methyltransferase [Anaerolineae bacterium]